MENQAAQEYEDFESEDSFDVDIEGEEDINIEIIDDTPEADRGRRPLSREVEDPSEEEIEQYGDKVKTRIKELTHARHDERRAKEAAHREKEEALRLAQQVIDENRKLKEYVDTGTKSYAEMLKAKTEIELQLARDKFKIAQESYDTDEIIAAQEALAEAKMRLEQAKAYSVPTLQTQNYDVYSQQPAVQPQPDERTLRWQQKNQWYGSPGYEEMSFFALGLHQKLVNQGISPEHNPDEYYGRLDARIREKFPELFFEETPKTTSVGKKPATVVAAANRTSSGKKVQLSATQLAIAKKFGLSPKQYAEAYVKTLEK